MAKAEMRPEGVSSSPHQLHVRRRARVLQLIATSFLLYAVTSFYFLNSFYDRISPGNAYEKAQECAIDNLHSDLSFLDPAVPITAEEFLERRDRLARALAASNVDAFVLEPGYTFQYYGNISQTDWEPWEPEERPFLMLVLPQISSSGKVSAKTAFLSPHFEEGRVRMLGIPSQEDELDIVIWEEHWNPYDTLLKSRLFNGQSAKLMVDEEIRDFIVRGLDSAGFETVGLNPEVELVRQQKSPAEVELLRVVNTGTVVAVRAMRPCLVPGLTENEVTEILNTALLSINFGLFFNIVLFEEHGALPHGGFVTGWKKLTPESMVVIDVGAHYLGYSSDICRSFFIDPPKSHSPTAMGFILQLFGKVSGEQEVLHTDPELRAEKFKVWDIVLDAQSAAAAAFKPNNTAASVDIAARKVIEDAGYGYGFTHRLGHGIGIKGICSFLA
ncbi:putative peptidase [Colletotrichum spaethianum]|uniref:Peptidase n=1 Tax=Colletotrichum spaethianum TaxID=700344 RepID=A0AA37PI20_9PEZI|nr:putative peptidase [Colletotrichum spaethianum]GKT52420.1 putative peptidase [Colletotrichum spaethianum]